MSGERPTVFFALRHDLSCAPLRGTSRRTSRRFATPDDDAGDFRAAAPIGTTDPDRDGIMVPVDTAAGERGASESPPWPSTAP
ncbi:hypothetical protein DWB68_09990 [Galactobacter valiniphilus]|uniref:Uncharacterized protein n=1 Tax=Galactobacter valiniphilus TaxID=2676122 RepID=A0A399J8F1_9MICC|nr:hypothetical protein DWB68_09990 [Galactobacter valiniphilus]